MEVNRIGHNYFDILTLTSKVIKVQDIWLLAEVWCPQIKNSWAQVCNKILKDIKFKGQN